MLAERDAQMAEQMEQLAQAAGARQEKELTARAMKVVQGMNLRVSGRRNICIEVARCDGMCCACAMRVVQGMNLRVRCSMSALSN